MDTVKYGKDLDNGCMVFNENGTIYQSSESDFKSLTIRVNSTCPKEGLELWMLSYDEYDNRKEKIYRTVKPHESFPDAGMYDLLFTEKKHKKITSTLHFQLQRCVQVQQLVF